MTKLATFNRALEMLGESPLADLTEAPDREAGRILTAAWDDGLLKFCLEQGQWNFATRTSMLEYSSSITPAFGLAYAFELPDDWVRWSGVSEDDRFLTPLSDYMHEAGFLFSDASIIYVRYVSTDTSYGGDFSLWPETFRELVAARLASVAALPLQKSEDVHDRIEKRYINCLLNAKNKDAAQEATRRPRRTSVTMARGRYQSFGSW